MLLLRILYLIPAIIAAKYQDHGNHQPSHIPNEGQISPNSNLVFNFEQLRRNQPPQVEMREENMGQYMYRPTTTVQPAMLDTRPMHVNRHVEHSDNLFQLSNILPPVANRYNQWNSDSMQSSTMPPPPPAPQLSDFTNSFKNHQFSYFNPSPPNLEHNLQASRDFYQLRFEEFTNRNASPRGNSQQQAVNRGHQKFKWNDVTTTVQPQYEPVAQQTSSITPSAVNQNRGPPPPAPTLTSWSDGFGK